MSCSLKKHNNCTWFQDYLVLENHHLICGTGKLAFEYSVYSYLQKLVNLDRLIPFNQYKSLLVNNVQFSWNWHFSCWCPCLLGIMYMITLWVLIPLLYFHALSAFSCLNERFERRWKDSNWQDNAFKYDSLLSLYLLAANKSPFAGDYNGAMKTWS